MQHQKRFTILWSRDSWIWSSRTRRHRRFATSWSWGGTVTIVTKSGARISSTVDAPRGSGPRGIDWSEVDAKYRALMPESSLPAKRIEESLALIHRFDQLRHVSDLTRLIG